MKFFCLKLWISNQNWYKKGLLLCIHKRLWDENTDNPKRFKIFKTEATIVGKDNAKYSFSEFPYQVLMTKENA